MNKRSYEIDMCNGPLLVKILLFSFPLMLSGILQLLFNAVDMIVVGQFAGSDALASVGATSYIINLLVNSFIGLSVGANVLVSHYYGAKRQQELSDTIHTSILISIIGGIILGIIGIIFSRYLLEITDTPSNVIDESTKYMQIYFAGVPALLIYNFGSAILRAIGDTKRPLYYLFTAGVINICLNIIFVRYFNMGVGGVALATIISQCVSATLIIRSLLKNDGPCHMEFKKLRINFQTALKIIRIGVPAGLQGALFSLSNILIQSSVNSFGSIAMAGNAAAASLEGFVYTSMNTFHQTALSFTSQNLGAKKYERIRKILLICLMCVTITGFIMGFGGMALAKPLLHIYSPKQSVISYGIIRVNVIFATYFLCGIMDTMVGALRGLGYSVMPMIVSLLGACGFRIVWIYTVFAQNRSLKTLYISYPVSWVITEIVHIICFIILYRKLLKKANTTN